MTIKQLVKKYNKYIDSYEYDEEHTELEGKKNYWVYLKEGYENCWGETCRMDNLKSLEYFLEDIAFKYKE